MLQTYKTFIGMDNWGYCQSTLGSLGNQNIGIYVEIPHQEQFLRDIDRGISIWIDFKTTLSTLEKMPMFSVGFGDMTTFGTSLRSVSSIYRFDLNSFLIGDLSEDLKELVERHSMKFPVGFFSKIEILSDSFDILNDNDRSIFLSQINYLMTDLIEPSFDETLFKSLQFPEFFGCFNTLQFGSSNTNISYFSSHVLTKVELSEGFVSERIIDTDSHVTNIHINAQDGVVIGSQFNFFGENWLDSENVIFEANHDRITFPPISEMGLESTPQPVWDNGDGQSPFVSGNCDYGITVGCGLEDESSVIISNGDISNSFGFLEFKNLPSCCLNNVGREASDFSVMLVSEVMQID